VLQNLNPQQQQAVDHKKGPLLIIAGAGTGKTAVITKRILNIINKGWAKPNEILALTFTEKASAEMFERVDREMPYGYDEVWISTFHSFCDRILRQEGHHIGLDSNYALMSQAKSYILFRKHLFEFPLKTLRPLGNPTSSIANILKHFSRLQDEDTSPEEYLAFVEEYAKNGNKDDSLKPDEYAKTLQEYQELSGTYKMYTDFKIAESKFDFGDLIMLTIKLFREKPNVLKMYRDLFKYILVDEFQDTNYTQNVLVNMLVDSENKKAKRNLTVVGDDDQAIYKFRGAAISNILHFNETYSDAKKIVLIDNYRSRQEILDASYNLISYNNPYRLEITESVDKKLRALGEFEPLTQDPIQLIIGKKSSEEADSVVKEILKLVGKSKESLPITNSLGQAFFLGDETPAANSYKFSDIAILVRANDHSEEFIQSMKYYGVPFKFSGPKGLYTRPEISPLISFLKILVDYTNDIEMFNLLRMPIWKISPREIAETMRFAKDRRESIFETLEFLWCTRLGENDSNPADLSQGSVETTTEADFKPKIRDISSEDSKNTNLLTRMYSKTAMLRISDFLMIIDFALQMIKSGSTPGELLYMFVKDSGYLANFTETATHGDDAKVQNISKFFETLKSFEKDNLSANVYSYIDFLNYSLEIGDSPSVEQDSLEDFDAVNISSVHASKGLEFPVVFLVNLVSDRFPSRNMSDRLPIPDGLIKDKLPTKDEGESHLQEERRLFYVGATRAKERLYLTAAQMYSGNKKPKKASIFFNEILSRDVSLEEDSTNLVLSGEVSLSEALGADLHLKFSSQDDLVEFNDIKMNFGTKFSYSQLNSFERCPKQYRYKYVLGLPGPKSPVQAFGRSVHNTLRAFYEQLKNFNEGLPGIVEMPDLEMLMNLYQEKWINEGFESKKHEKIRKEQGEIMLRDFYEKSITGEEKPIELEKPISYKVNDILMKGQVDRIDLIGLETLEDGKVRKIVQIIDYKTGKLKDKEDVEDDLQLSLYAIALEQFDEYRVEGASLVFVEHNAVVPANVSQKNKDKVKDRVIELVGDIRKGMFVATPNFRMCGYCDYRTICSDAAV